MERKGGKGEGEGEEEVMVVGGEEGVEVNEREGSNSAGLGRSSFSLPSFVSSEG